MTVTSQTSFHGVTKIHANTFSDLDSAPIMLELEGDDWKQGSVGLTIYTHDHELADAVVAAINGAVESVKAGRAATKVLEAAL